MTRVVFVPDGGFNKRGAFVELEDGQSVSDAKDEYERQGFLRLPLKAFNVRITRTVSAANAPIDAEQPEAPKERGPSIIADCSIQPSRWSRFSLSILGRKTNYSKLHVWLHGVEEESDRRVFAAGMKPVNDLDLEIDEQFFVEAHIPKQQLHSIIEQLDNPGTELFFSVEIWKFPNFFATWSPSISDGRVIKFLDDKKDIENLDQVPEDFFDKRTEEEILSRKYTSPIEIQVVRQVIDAPEPNEDDADFDDEVEERAATRNSPVVDIDILPVARAIASLANEQKKTRTLLVWSFVGIGAVIALGLI